MSEEISSLFELLNVAIGTPQRAVVNFSALHALLHEVLRHLDIREMKTTWRDTTPGDCSLDAPVGVGALKQDQDPGQSDTSTGQRELQPGTELPERISSSRIRSCEDGVSEDPGQSDTSTGERELQPGMEPPERISSSRIRSCEDGVSEDPGQSDTSTGERELQPGMEPQERNSSSRIRSCEDGVSEDPGQSDTSTGERELQPGMEPPERISSSRIRSREDGVSEAMKLIQELHREMKELCHQQKVEAETASDVEKCCHRVDALEESVTSLRDTVQKYPDPEQLSHQCEAWDLMQAALLSQRGDEPTVLVHSGLVDAAAEVNATHTPFNSNLTAGSAAPPPSSTLNPVEEAGRPAAPGAPTTPGQTSMDAGTPLSGPPQQTGFRADQTAGSSLSERHSEMLEALRSIGQLGARLAALEEGKADQSQLRHLREHISDESSQDALNHLMDQLNQQRALIDCLMSDREKLDSPEDMFMNLSSQERETGSVASGGEESDSSASRELRQQDRKSVRKLVKQLVKLVKQLKAQLALCVERATDGDLQDQLDDLRGTLEDTMQSLTSQLSEAGQDESAGGQSKAQSRGQSRENTGRKLSLLFQHYEQLQDTVSGLLQQQTGRPAGPPDLENVELMNIVQKAILEIQGECEKLHETTRSLSDDSRQKQSHIEELFKMTEKLEEKKADKQMVESGIKAEKSALESKVSRLQFDSVTEQLNVMFHELLSKVTDQEQDWNNVVEQLSTEMECKLSRMELDSVKEQLEERWKNIHKKLQAAQGALEHEDAAGIRKQLVDRFHCLSCDRPVVMHTPGQHLKLPSSGFPSHKSIRPFTVYALEQFRQHYRSLKPGTNRLNYEAAVRRREQLQRSHAVTCSQIDSMQGTPRHGDRTGSCTTAGERIYEARSCGGSHTLTSTNQRRTGLKTVKHHSQVEVDQSEEVDIIGLDGHIYKGRLNTPARNTETKLPTISTKDGKAKDKTRCSLPQKPAASPDVHHPLSVKSAQCSHSGSSSSGRDWPVSALGCTSQSSVSPSAAAESGSERRADEPPGL